MNLTNYPLERFLTWLTGGDKRVSVVIDETIAAAIEADPDAHIAKVVRMTSNCIVVYWADSPEFVAKAVDWGKEYIKALEAGDIVKAKQIQQQMKQLKG